MKKRIGWPSAASLGSVMVSLLFLGLAGFPGSSTLQIERLVSKAHAEEKKGNDSITKLRIQPLYKAAKLTWRAEIEDGEPVTFEIYRSKATPDGPYTLITSIEWNSAKKKYQYVDKNLPVEENYFYKIEIPERKESYGPFQVRPPFSLPTT